MAFFLAMIMHCHATKQADLFLLGVINPDSRIDVRLMPQSDQQVKENKEILRQLVMAVEFLAKQALPFRGHRDTMLALAMKTSIVEIL